MEQSGSGDVSGLTVKKFIITVSSVFLFLFQLESKNVDLITVSSLILGVQMRIPCDLLYPTIAHFAPRYSIM